jgi:chromosome segregation ATPase
VEDSLALMPLMPSRASYQCIPQQMGQLFSSGGLLGRLACLGAVEDKDVGAVLCRKAGASLNDFICSDDRSADALMAILRQNTLFNNCSALADEAAVGAYAPGQEVDARHPQQVGC